MDTTIKETYIKCYTESLKDGGKIADYIKELQDELEKPYDVKNLRSEVWFLGVPDIADAVLPSIITEYHFQKDGGDVLFLYELLEHIADRMEELGTHQFSVSNFLKLQEKNKSNALVFSKEYESCLDIICKNEFINLEGALYIFSPIRYLQTLAEHIKTGNYNKLFAMYQGEGVCSKLIDKLKRPIDNQYGLALLTENFTQNDYSGYWPFLYGEITSANLTNNSFTPYKEKTSFHPTMLPVPFLIKKKIQEDGKDTYQENGYLMYNTCLPVQQYHKVWKEEKPEQYLGATLDQLCEFYRHTGTETVHYTEPFCYRIRFTEADKKIVKGQLSQLNQPPLLPSSEKDESSTFMGKMGKIKKSILQYKALHGIL